MSILNKVLDIPSFWNLVQAIFGCDNEKRRVYRSVFKNTGRLLDFGCANGNTFLAFTDFEYYGVDINLKLLQYAKKKYAYFKNAHFVNANILDNPFPSEFFDFVLFGCTGHHLEKEMFIKIFRALARVLKKGGRFHIFDLVKSPGRDSPLLRLTLSLDQGKFIRDEKKYHYILAELSDILEVVETNTFDVKKRFMPLPRFFHAELKKI